jgi:hypothetical protein
VTLLDVLELRETPFGDCGTGIEPQIQLLIAEVLKSRLGKKDCFSYF